MFGVYVSLVKSLRGVSVPPRELGALGARVHDPLTGPVHGTPGVLLWSRSYLRPWFSDRLSGVPGLSPPRYQVNLGSPREVTQTQLTVVKGQGTQGCTGRGLLSRFPETSCVRTRRTSKTSVENNDRGRFPRTLEVCTPITPQTRWASPPVHVVQGAVWGTLDLKLRSTTCVRHKDRGSRSGRVLSGSNDSVSVQWYFVAGPVVHPTSPCRPVQGPPTLSGASRSRPRTR